MSNSMDAALLGAAALLAGVGGCRAGSEVQQRPPADGPRIGEGQWAFRVTAADGVASDAVTVMLEIECAVARDAAGTATRTETRRCQHPFAEGTIAPDVALLFAYLLREQVAGLGIEIEHEPGSESVFVEGPDLVGIAAGCEDASVVAIHMSCTVGPPGGRRLVVPESERADRGR